MKLPPFSVQGAISGQPYELPSDIRGVSERREFDSHKQGAKGQVASRLPGWRDAGWSYSFEKDSSGNNTALD